MLLIGHPPHGSEPVLQRDSGSMEDRPRRNRSLVSTLAAHQETSCGCPTAVSRALGATKPGRPPQPSQISTTRTFCGEALLKLGEGPHIVLHKVTPLFLRRTGVKCIVLCAENNTRWCCMSRAQGYLRLPRFRHVNFHHTYGRYVLFLHRRLRGLMMDRIMMP